MGERKRVGENGVEDEWCRMVMRYRRIEAKDNLMCLTECKGIVSYEDGLVKLRTWSRVQRTERMFGEESGDCQEGSLTLKPAGEGCNATPGVFSWFLSTIIEWINTIFFSY